MSLLIKADGKSALLAEVTPASAGWSFVGFRMHRLQSGDGVDWQHAQRECCMVVLSGIVSVQADDQHWREIGQRTSVFDTISPYAVYLPNGPAMRVTAHTAAEIAFCSAPGQATHKTRLITPEHATRSVRGKGSNTRYVCDILPQTQPADHLLVVEVLTPGGHSSSYPPHKHDTDNFPEETFLEETYYHRLNPQQGYALQRVYTDDRSLDETYTVENHDVVMVPRGYHPVSVPHGYDSYYLNVMAGPTRHWQFRNDPQHAWLMAS